MKKLRILSTSALAILTCAVIVTACQKSSTTTTSTTTADADAAILGASATADDQSNAVYNGVFDNVMGVNDDAGLGAGIGVFFAPSTSGSAQFGNGTDSTGTPCYTVTVDPVTRGVFPKTITIDFGTGCTGADGRTRRGKIITVYTGKMKTPGSKATTTFDGFYVDSIKVEGTHIVENQSTTDNRVFTLTLQNGKLTSPSGSYVAANRTHTWTQTSGSSTPNLPGDDVYQITGSSDGTASAAGVTVQWSTNITQPVVRNFTCRWAVSGQVTITHNAKTGVLDYGTGTCDNKATLTVGTKTYDITLR